MEHEGQPVSLDQHNTVSLRHAHAPGIELPAPQPKPTSISGQLEATVNLWERWLRLKRPEEQPII